ncbi:FemAB family XrtA/PEP-CTERM system-associated protein [Stakelama pacifica]|uniref:FemAB-related protein (PEP-CTERM system-associated) n=1 Tax=Stakelama pacifica TaxID=517720 RepID=A0A4R6FF04_9SPHN|nr:FemAB family XrtA/PEP-CTERM system-associated protein [Stakelama pacifica]TDN79871.1 FemAB-related protein (PEP-CTERM system-associated) [Stakelama pacifica]GGO98067.1 peptidoglycan bridge formation protein FemAB [Stakelama pacifica]
MTVQPPAGMVTTRLADLDDARECDRLRDFVDEHPDGTPFHLPQWSAAIERGCGQHARYLIAEHHGKLVGVLPLTEMRSPLFGNAMVSAGFAVGGGALVRDAAALEPLVLAGWALAEDAGCGTMELRGGPCPGAQWHADSESYLGFVAALAGDDAAQLAAIPRKQRAEVRKALNGDLTVDFGRERALRRDHYAVYAESVRNLGTPVFPRALFDAVLDAFDDASDILIVRSEHRPVAAVLSLYWRGCVYPYWGGGVHAARALRANDRMYYALMCHARRKACDRFDFGRSKVGTGPAAFKKNWGFTPEPLTYWARASDGGEPRKINPLSPKYRLQVAAWKKLPLWLANRIGPPIARGLG